MKERKKIPNCTVVFQNDVTVEELVTMFPKGFDGDIVIVKKKSNANNGEIVVAMTDENEVTLKRFYKENGHIRLQPENDFLEPIILNNVTILGKAIGLYRKI